MSIFDNLRRRATPAPAAAPTADVAALLGRAIHDIRGTISPALLMSEQLESHADPAVRAAAAAISEALDRATQICRETTTAAKHLTSGS